MCDCETCESLADLRRRYQHALNTKIAAGHEDDPDCECPPCVAERNLYFMEQHFFDDVDGEMVEHAVLQVLDANAATQGSEDVDMDIPF